MSLLGRGRCSSSSRALVLLLGAAFVVASVALTATAQKRGICPPLLGSSGACLFTCYEDFDCPGATKCCKTTCGGTVCSRPVSPPRTKPRNEIGECPAVTSTPWVCSYRCSNDDDCDVGKKCCQHRCGGRSCLRAATPSPSVGFAPGRS